ncbi:hypothetical protein CDCA_CDCA04G1445 [Cyanidium caldarium]|uniref:Uncharacterized protein n=1 Tax=Cyanidium caldarium TaxID=2771 RepID=A0AAV9ITJ4_CYACA|nr:hypothetical protein CDCA_CDCA04G1445 [Cyanidium caldarium]
MFHNPWGDAGDDDGPLSFGAPFGVPAAVGPTLNRRGAYDRQLRCYSLAFSAAAKPEYERGDKVLLPPSHLAELIERNVAAPMVFRVTCVRSSRTTHVGVIEFTAEEGTCYAPHWLMENLAAQEGDLVRLQSASLPKAEYAKLQPQLTEFTRIRNPRAVLETRLRHFTALTRGDEIAIEYNGKTYWITVVECRPAEAVCVIETDVSVEFAPPRDAAAVAAAEASGSAEAKEASESTKVRFGRTGGGGDGGGGEVSKSRALRARKTQTASGAAESANENGTENYWARLGGGRTLSGRASERRAMETPERRGEEERTGERGEKLTPKFPGEGRTLREG